MGNGGRSLGVAAAEFNNCYHLAWEFPHVLLEHSPREEANVVAHEHQGMATSVECVGLMLDPPNQM